MSLKARRGRPETPHVRRLTLPTVAVMVALLVGGIVAQVREQRAASAAELADRFTDRIGLAAEYVESHVEEMHTRQLRYARHALADGEVTAEQFDDAVLSFGFEAAVLLDSDGTALAVSPRNDQLIGTPVAAGYDHLRAALAGRVAVSGVVPSASRHEPIIAVAVPFRTRAGLRVISGGYAIDRTPLAAFVAATTSLQGREVFLVDGADGIVAGTEVGVSRDLASVAPALAGLHAGVHDLRHRDSRFHVAVSPVPGTPWRLVAAVPRDELLAPVEGAARTEWLVIGVALVLAAVALVLVRRLSHQRDEADAESRTDLLTGLPNRRAAEDALAVADAASRRSGSPYAVAIIDVDHFKSINDRFGHRGGDQVLRRLSQALSAAARRADVVARWGGEELVIVMSGADTMSAAAAERLRQAVGLVRTEDGGTVTVSIGVAAAAGESAERLVALADAALYDAKRNGRDRVEVAGPSDLSQLVPDPALGGRTGS